MNFLEAHRIAASFAGGPPLDFLLGVSGGTEKLRVFLAAAGAKLGRSVNVRTFPFNTLGQNVLAPSTDEGTEVFVLFPWDFVPELDWRSGLPASTLDFGALQQSAQTLANRLQNRAARILYVPAPIPPAFSDPASAGSLQIWLATLARGIGAAFLAPEVFSLASYLSNGNPFAGAQLGNVAERVVESALGTPSEPAKVLVTDLDNVMWHGVVGEDGVDGIRYSAEGTGYRHFLYQTFLAKLKREGALLAAVSRNDRELALAPFETGQMTLRVDDLVVVIASYNAKSAQIRNIAHQLNLGLDSFVFVDDNPIELEEVSQALPELKTLRFPGSDDELPAFFETLAGFFARATTTAEDTQRTELYRRRLEGMVPDAAEGGDLTAFLRGLEMSMIIHDRSQGDRARAVQLINKTNQFNLNGRRVTDEEVGAVLAAGGRLYGATLNDRTGSHGEVLACLIDERGVIRSLVMSCRIFQRRLEYAFLTWLANEQGLLASLDFALTARNEPIRHFLSDPAFASNGTDGLIQFDAEAFSTSHRNDLALFKVVPPAPSPAVLRTYPPLGVETSKERIAI